MACRRVVVTGVGLLTSLGHLTSSVWGKILAGESGVRINSGLPDGFPSRISSEVLDFKVDSYGLPREILQKLRKMDEFISYGVVAAKIALEDSGLEPIDEAQSRACGVAVGAGIGGIRTIEHYYGQYSVGGVRRISPFFVPGTIINMTSGMISIMSNFKGPNYAIVSACATGAHNIGAAARNIERGEADVMLAGGCESVDKSVLCFGGFASAKALSTRNDEPQQASRPWDRDRDGFVIGSGAGVVVLEEYEHAKKRSAHIYGELVGYGTSADAWHITMPNENGDGMVAAMEIAIKDAGSDVGNKIGYINAHATSTPLGDKIESLAIERAFGDRAAKIPVSSTKSMLGHMLGAAGSVEAILTLLALQSQQVPPTINLENPGDGCRLDYVPNHARDHKFTYAMSNSFGFGGTNASLIFRQVS
ncbi:MAG: beta-ketoacyl-ACP synthase II [Candidatus Porifericomitaceae bacterium WSBS_2022_MAG_OTU9]